MNAGDTAWVLISAALVLFMTVGLAFFYGGLEPKRNVLDMMAMNFFTISLVTVVWVLIGFSLAFAPDAGFGLIGGLHYAALDNMGGLWPGTHIPKLDYMGFQLMFAIITPALITGAIAGRMKFEAWIAFCIGWSLVVYPVIAHWVFDPSGWIYKLGGRDFAGGSVVHASAGFAALVVVLMVGPRITAARSAYLPHAVPLVMLGAGILWFGWFGFNAGSALGANQLAANAFTVTQIAAVTGLLAWVTMERITTGRVTLVGLATGAIVGLATITPASGYVGPMPALLIGAVAGTVCYLATRALSEFQTNRRCLRRIWRPRRGGRARDVVRRVLCALHVNPSGLTATDGAHLNGVIFGNVALLGYQIIAICATVGFVVAATYCIAALVRSTIGLRVADEQEEVTGLNVVFDASVYEL